MMWENLHISEFSRTCRKLFSWILSLLIIGTLVVLVVLISKQSKNQSKQGISCKEDEYYNTKDPAFVEMALRDYVSEKTEGVMQCFCIKRYMKIGTEEFTLPNGKKERICLKIYNSYFVDIGIGAIMSCFLSACSFLVNWLLTKLSKFESHADRNDMCKSRILKGFMLKYLTTCLLTIVINFKFKLGQQEIGEYDDFSPSWFRNIGYSLLLALMLKIIVNPLIVMLMALRRALSRCYDRGCSLDLRKTKKKNHEEYEKLYTQWDFNLDDHYTEEINVIFIAFTLSPILPWCYAVCFVYCIVLYWKDKIQLFTMSRKPLPFDRGLSQRSRQILFYGVILWSIAAMMVLGNTNLLSDANTASFAKQGLSDWQKSIDQKVNQYGVQSKGSLLNKYLDRFSGKSSTTFVYIGLGILVAFLILKYIALNMWGFCKKNIFCWCVCSDKNQVHPSQESKGIIPFMGRVLRDYYEKERSILNKEFRTHKENVPTQQLTELRELPENQVDNFLRLKRLADFEAGTRLKADIMKKTHNNAIIHSFTHTPSYHPEYHPDFRYLFLKKAGMTA